MLNVGINLLLLGFSKFFNFMFLKFPKLDFSSLFRFSIYHPRSNPPVFFHMYVPRPNKQNNFTDSSFVYNSRFKLLLSLLETSPNTFRVLLVV